MFRSIRTVAGVAFALVASTATWANAADSTAASPEGALAEARSVDSSVQFTPASEVTSCSSRSYIVRPDLDPRPVELLLGISEMANEDGESAQTYCERAIDPSCVGCFIGCPSGCWCICGGWFSQCCCDAT